MLQVTIVNRTSRISRRHQIFGLGDGSTGHEVGLLVGYFLVLNLGHSCIPGYTGPPLKIWTKRETCQTENVDAKILRLCLTCGLQLNIAILKCSLASGLTILDSIYLEPHLLPGPYRFQFSVRHVRYESR